MSRDGLPTIWPAEPHTLAKHGILKSYLEAWAAILSNAKNIKGSELLFFDGFAGPGEYSTGENGSPIIALNAVIEHTRTFTRPVRFRFVENDPPRHAHLCARLAREKPRIAASGHVRVDPPVLGECEAEVRNLIATRNPLGPALFFFDQFGYSHVSMDLIRGVFEHSQCEVFSYMNCEKLAPYLPDPTKAASITDAWGGESWRPAITLSGQARKDHLIESYKTALRTIAKADYPWSFAMFSDRGELLHWLVFATKSLDGLREMKKAMWKADKIGGFRFSDRDNPSQQTFFSDMDTKEWHADRLAALLTGQTLTLDKMEEFVLTQTPFYKWEEAVNRLKKEGRASSVRGDSKWPIRFH